MGSIAPRGRNQVPCKGRSGWRSLVAVLSVAAWLAPGASVAMTKSFVLSYFYPANYYGDDTCPQGLNPLADVFFKRDLKLLGMPQAEIDAMFNKDYSVQNGKTTTNWVSVVATRGNGKDNVYLHPTTVPDAHLLPASGRFGYGFNLDGRGALSPNSYEDPETHQKGVNNQLFRVLGCVQAYKGYPPPQPPLEAEYRWDYSRAAMGAWLVSISAEDLAKDGDVTVTLETSIDPITTQDANAHLQSDMTYRVAARPTSHNVLRGRIKDGVITTDPASITMTCDAYIQPVYEFLAARLRLKIKADGTLEGVLGGYQPWYPLYWSHANVGYIDERGFGVDAPALYYALRREADAYPDPKTGRNTAISAAYMIEAVPAFVASADEAFGPDSRSRPASARGGRASGLIPALWNAEPKSPGAPAVARRLSPDQYRRIIADVFGPAIKIEGRFEPQLRDSGLFAVGASRLGVTSSGLEQYDAMARSVAAQVVSEEHRGTLIPCTPQSATASDDACAARFFAAAGPLLYRRPLEKDETKTAIALAHVSAQALQNFYSGLAMSLAGMLESPQFLFRAQIGEADPEVAGAYRLDAYSKASQLSFFLWNAGPDPKLIAAAASGKLATISGLGDEVDRMIESPRLEAGVRAFFADLLQFDLFDSLAKDSKIFPKWTFKVARDAEEQTLRTIVDLVLTQQGDYRDLFTSRKTFLTPLLGSVYRVPVAQRTDAWERYEFAAGDPRAGIQSQASFVALHSHEGLSSPTLRGKALRELLLCEPIPAPPGNVNFAVAQDTHNPNFKTMRDRLTAHRTDPTCAGCHKLMDPIGLALESFDSDAGYRAFENGRLIDTSGELDGVAFSDAAGLGRAIHDNPATGACLARRLYSYATGRAPARRDMAWIRFLEKRFADSGYRVPDLMRQIAASENFYRVAPPAASGGGSSATLASMDGLNEGTGP
jgi:Protein of unknown function (DUF1592)/Protein of unknown function (DUF1588)/Protein of unknown function (DUF1585)/Protein of unknown function (DUF1595)/Protein of unknown function (DUF1587)